MRGDERGSVLLTVLGVALVISVLATILVREAVADLGQTSRTVETNRALQAAQAGIDDYIAKLTEDHSYYDHFTHPAESTRRAADGALVGPSSTWTGDTEWTYPNGRDTWRPFGDGMAYNLRVERPTAARTTVRIVATGKRATGNPELRTLEAFVRPASLADFQMLANRSITYGVTAKTYGKIYAGIEKRVDAITGAITEVPHNVTHKGEAHADLYAEGTVRFGDAAPALPTGTLHDGARSYDSTRSYDGTTYDTTVKIRNPGPIHQPIDFNAFAGSLTDIQGVARAGGLVLDDPSWDVWWLTFRDNGTVEVRGCDGVSIGTVRPVACGAVASHPVPANGAVWAQQPPIVEGEAKGRFTVASAGDIYVGGSLTYDTPGRDVVGLIADDNMVVPQWAPSTMTWSAATLTIKGIWRSELIAPADASSALTFSGSTATNLGGYMSQFATRNYVYDRHLLYLPPPYFPVLEEAYTVVLQREITD